MIQYILQFFVSNHLVAFTLWQNIVSIYLNNEVCISSFKLKQLLIEHNIFINCCQICGIHEWQNKPISLHLHHIDGNRKNNALDNLQLLCPNCHSQTNNYSGKNKRKSPKPIISDDVIISCIESSYSKREALLKSGLAGYGGSYERINNVMSKYNVKLLPNKFIIKRKNYLTERLNSIIIKRENCNFIKRQTKIIWPDNDKLIELVKSKSMIQVAKELGVSKIRS